MPHEESLETSPRLIDQQNRVALPAEVLDALGAKRGDHLVFRLFNGRVTLHKATWTVSD